MNGIRQLEELTPDESLRLLGSVSLGRIVFTMQALPAIRPVNHIVDAGVVVIRSHLGSAIVSHVDGTGGAVVAYEADCIHPADHLGWSVVVTGLARIVHDPAKATRYRRILTPWISRHMDHVIEVTPQIITGFRLIDGAPASAENAW